MVMLGALEAIRVVLGVSCVSLGTPLATSDRPRSSSSSSWWLLLTSMCSSSVLFLLHLLRNGHISGFSEFVDFFEAIFLGCSHLPCVNNSAFSFKDQRLQGLYDPFRALKDCRGTSNYRHRTCCSSASSPSSVISPSSSSSSLPTNPCSRRQ